MVNLIGAVPSAADVLAVPGAHLHLYGKEPRPGRKLGHVTLVEPTEASERALHALVSDARGGEAAPLGVLRGERPRERMLTLRGWISALGRRRR